MGKRKKQALARRRREALAKEALRVRWVRGELVSAVATAKGRHRGGELP